MRQTKSFIVGTSALAIAACVVLCAPAILVPIGLSAEGDALEAQLNAEEEIERRTMQEHHEAPHFKKEVD